MKPRQYFKGLRRRAREQIQDISARVESLERDVDELEVTGEYEVVHVPELPELEDGEPRPRRTR